MNRVLRKRLGRELKTNFARYLALVLLIVMGMYIIVSVVASADTIIDGTAEHGKQNKVEDGQFGVFIPLTDEQEKEQTSRKRKYQTKELLLNSISALTLPRRTAQSSVFSVKEMTLTLSSLTAADLLRKRAKR